MYPLAKTKISLAHGFLFSPVRGIVSHLGPHHQQLLPHGLKLVGKCMGLLAGRGRCVGDDHGSLFASVLALGPIGKQTFCLLALFQKATIVCGIGRFETIQGCRRQFLSKIGGVGGNKMHPGMVVNPGIIIIGVHALVDNYGESLFGLVQAADNAEHLIHDRFEILAVMKIAGINAIM